MRGFDKLDNPVGVFIILACLLFFTAFVAFGGIWWKLAARRDSERRREMRETWEAERDKRDGEASGGSQ